MSARRFQGRNGCSTNYPQALEQLAHTGSTVPASRPVATPHSLPVPPPSPFDPMIKYTDSSLFDSPTQTLVNTVNTVGVMEDQLWSSNGAIPDVQK